MWQPLLLRAGDAFGRPRPGRSAGQRATAFPKGARVGAARRARPPHAGASSVGFRTVRTAGAAAIAQPVTIRHVAARLGGRVPVAAAEGRALEAPQYSAQIDKNLLLRLEASQAASPDGWSSRSRRAHAHSFFQYPAMMVPSMQGDLM